MAIIRTQHFIGFAKRLGWGKKKQMLLEASYQLTRKVLGDVARVDVSEGVFVKELLFTDEATGQLRCLLAHFRISPSVCLTSFSRFCLLSVPASLSHCLSS